VAAKHIQQATGEEAAAAASLAPSDAAEAEAVPLEAEAHWRLYQNAAFLQSHLDQLVESDGLNLQDFMFHV
jgi:hypothetical protein